MRKLFLALIIYLVPVIYTWGQTDVEGSKDPALFSRMPGFHIDRYDDVQFDRYDFQVKADKTEPVEGHYLFIIYWLNENSTAPSPLQIVRNYTNAIKKIGGQVIYEFEDGGSQNSIMKVSREGTETWVHLMAQVNGSYWIKIIEKEAMSQDVIADAASMAKSISESGRVALYGIYFDTGLSVLKPESTPALQEISKLLTSDPSLRLFIVGHTDNTGSFDANMKLSLERANSVVNVLVTKYSVNPSRLKPWGNGPTSPVSSNDTEKGKALNRRVELVRQ